MTLHFTKDHTVVIAEIGINHNGNLELAKKLIERAKESNADAVKFQKRDVDSMYSIDGLKMPYNNPNSYGETYGEHKHQLEFSKEQFMELKTHAILHNIAFGASCWDIPSADILNEIGMDFFKIASADLTNTPLLIHLAKISKVPILLSTGMSDMKMVKNAYKVLRENLENKVQIIIMQCTSSYPTNEDEIHLNVIKTFIDEFPDIIIGFSGHEKGIALSTCAVALGARVIERHFTLDRTMKGNDHSSSLEPEGLKKLVRDIRYLEHALGGFKKEIQPSEISCIKKMRKSIVATRNIKRDEILLESDITIKCTCHHILGEDISPELFYQIAGNYIATEDISYDKPLTNKNVKEMIHY